MPELSPFLGYADTVSVDPNLHLVAHSKGGEKQLGFQTNLENLRGNSKTGSQSSPRLSIQNACFCFVRSVMNVSSASRLCGFA
jgi:hypothetical protein